MIDTPAVAFLFDVDNTLLDNDAVKRDLGVQLDATVHAGASGEYWKHYEALRHVLGHSDFLATFQRCWEAIGRDPRWLPASAPLLDYRFASQLYPGALDLLDAIGLTSFVMTTGSRGLHVTVPLDASVDFEASRTFTRRVAELAAKREPDRLTTEQRKDQRGWRLYLDVMRNAYGQTAVTPYAVRAKPGTPIVMPLAWDELGDGRLRADRYRITNVFRRLAQKNDAWHQINKHAASLEKHETHLDQLERETA